MALFKKYQWSNTILQKRASLYSWLEWLCLALMSIGLFIFLMWRNDTSLWVVLGLGILLVILLLAEMRVKARDRELRGRGK